MTLCTLMILLASQDRPGRCGAELKRCEQMSYPEKQAWQALKSRRKTLKDEVMMVSKEIILKNVLFQGSHKRGEGTSYEWRKVLI